MDSDYQIIVDGDSLRSVVREMKAAPCIALDTEFVWERTYYARLGLIQVGMPDGRCFLLDAVELPDLTPLGDVLSDPSVMKVLHDAPQDLMIMHRATGTETRNVFDTRLAAGFVGLSSELSLQNLLSELLEVDIPKGHTRADWTLRPLEDHLLVYAVDDVHYLPRLADTLTIRAREAGVEEWMNEELKALEALPLCREPVPEEQYLRVKSSGSLSERGVAALRELAAWREVEARRVDRPRRHVAEDAELVSVAYVLPGDFNALRTCKRLGPRTARRYGEDLLEAVRRGLETPEAERPEMPCRPDIRKLGKQRVDGVFHQIGALARERQIDPQLVTSKSGVLMLLHEWPDADPDDHRLMRGWRSELLGDTLNLHSEA
jgi:ribonuclease D